MQRLFRYVSAAVLAAAVSFSGPASGQFKSDRIPAGPVNMFQAGAAFTFHANATDPARIEGLNTALNLVSTQSEENARLVDRVRDVIARGVSDSTDDQLARAVAVAVEGTFSIILQSGFVRAMSESDPSLGPLMQTARTRVHLPGNEEMDVPMLLGAAAHSLTMISAGQRLRAAQPTFQIAGTWHITTLGQCPFDDADVRIEQKDFVIEIALGPNLLLYGAVGPKKAFLVANERRFARITETEAGPPNVEVPDRPSDFYEGTIPADGGEIAFRSITRGKCAFKLVRTT